MTDSIARPIVVVEDSDEDFIALCRALKKNSVQARVVRYIDGQSFLDGLQSEGDRPPAFVFLDLNLPAMTGSDILRVMRGDPKLRRTPVVVLTSSSNPKDVRDCYDLGVGGYLLKQADFDSFCDVVHTTTDYWLGAVRLP